MGFFDGLFGGGGTREAREIEKAGRVLVCPICQGQHFWTRMTLMNTPGMAIMDIDWANKQAEAHICDNCGYIYWFMPQD